MQDLSCAYTVKLIRPLLYSTIGIFDRIERMKLSVRSGPESTCGGIRAVWMDA